MLRRIVTARPRSKATIDRLASSLISIVQPSALRKAERFDIERLFDCYLEEHTGVTTAYRTLDPGIYGYTDSDTMECVVSCELAEDNSAAIEKLFKKLLRQKRAILFVNDATLYLQAGRFQRFVEVLDTASTQIINAYYGRSFADSDLTRREKNRTEDLMKACDKIIKMPCRTP